MGPPPGHRAGHGITRQTTQVGAHRGRHALPSTPDSWGFAEGRLGPEASWRRRHLNWAWKEGGGGDGEGFPEGGRVPAGQGRNKLAWRRSGREATSLPQPEARSRRGGRLDVCSETGPFPQVAGSQSGAPSAAQVAASQRRHRSSVHPHDRVRCSGGRQGLLCPTLAPALPQAPAGWN